MGVLYLASVIFGIAHNSTAQNNGNSSSGTESQKTNNSDRIFTKEELASFDGKNGSPTYVAYKDIVYDVSESKLFQEGEHYGHLSGKDLTDAMAEAPHADEVFEGFEVVGKLETTERTPNSNNSDDPSSHQTQPTKARKILPIIFLGKSLSAWTGYLLGLIIVFNFATCYVMPWCGVSLPWKGKYPGPDKFDKAFLKLSYYHRYFAWLTVIFGILHGVLGIFQSFGIYI